VAVGVVECRQTGCHIDASPVKGLCVKHAKLLWPAEAKAAGLVKTRTSRTLRALPAATPDTAVAVSRSSERSTTAVAAGRAYPDFVPEGWPREPEVAYGYTDPLEFTAPLRELTPETSLGFEVIRFAAEVLQEPLLPWQQWLVVHAMELLPNGRPRFRTVLVLVARQNGKSHLARVIALYFLYELHVALVLGTAQTLDIARVLWDLAVDMAQGSDLRDEVEQVVRANGRESLIVSSEDADGRRYRGQYRIAASNRSAGRSLTVDLLFCDELREQLNWAGWSSLSKTTMAKPQAQIWALSNAGDDASVVLNKLEGSAKTGDDADSTGSIGLFRWAAPADCALDDVEGWRHANPALGITITVEAILSALETDPPAVFRTEVLCQRVDALVSAVDMAAWRSCADSSNNMAPYRGRVVLGLDVASDGAHVSMIAATSMADGRHRVVSAGAWSSTSEARKALPGVLAAVKPALLVWFPSGPAASIGADLRKLTGVDVIELTGGEVTEACQELAEEIKSHQVVHPGDPMINAHLSGARQLKSGDGWRFVRSDASHVDAAYAMAGALHALRTLPATRPVLLPRVV
jgi:hypothetical protein